MRFGYFLIVALVVGFSVGVATIDRAQAQLATDLVCNGCVNSTDVQDGSLGPQDLIPGSINTTTIANTSITGNKISGGAVTGAPRWGPELLAVQRGAAADSSHAGRDDAHLMPRAVGEAVQAEGDLVAG